MKNQVEIVTLKNTKQYINTIDRESFTCIEINIPNNGEWIDRIQAYANRIKKNLNRGQANTSKLRELSTVEIDNLSGLIAENACDTILRWCFGEDNIIKPQSDSSFNQIDIKLSTGKTIEVRSSCVRNGIGFAVFAKDKSGKQQYFDVIGPYSNDYKPGETLKDYYMRVLYWCDKSDFMSLLDKQYITLYITGGATKSMMLDKNIYQDKHLIPSGGQVQVESDYRVIPLGRSLDAKDFFELIAKENCFNCQHIFSRNE